MIGKRVLIPLKGIFLSAEHTRTSGFRNVIVTGILMDITPDGTLILGTEEGDELTRVPKDSIGAILTDGSSFFQGSDDHDDVNHEGDRGLN